MDKNRIIEILQSIDGINREDINHYLNKIEKVNEEGLQKMLKEKNINTEKDLKNYVINNMNMQDKFIVLNDLVSYGISGNTIHIHVVPKDAKFLLSREGLNVAEFKLIDALEKLQEIISNDEKLKNINQIYAVSGLIKKLISKLFENLEFDVKSMKIDEAKNDEELKKFYERFKDKNNLGRAMLSKEKLYSQEWDKLKNDRKSELSFKLKLDEINELVKDSDIKEVEKVLIEEMQKDEKEKSM